MNKEIVSKLKEFYPNFDPDVAMLVLSLTQAETRFTQDGERLSPASVARLILEGHSLERKVGWNSASFDASYWEITPPKGPECSCASHFKAFKRHAPLCKLEPK